MTDSDFLLTIDGEAADARRLECHFQGDPFPGGHCYELIIHDKDTIDYAKKEFGIGIHRQISDFKSISLLSFLGGMKSIKIGRENPPQFWANTIDDLEVSDDRVVLKGVCSPHVDG
jgi:hypothetical protein